MINIVQDAQEYSKQFGLIADKGRKVYKALPLIGVGLGVAATNATTKPIAVGTLKAMGKIAQTGGKLAKGIATTPLKSLGLAAGAVHVGTKMQRHLYKTPSGTQVLLGSFTGYLPDKDKQLLRRSKFRLTDLISGHHQTRLLMKMIRPSWFKENKGGNKL